MKFEALEAIDKASRLADSGQWSLAAGALQEVSEKYSDSLIPVEPKRFVGVRQFVQERVSRWPAEGLAAYRANYEAAARAALAIALREKSTDGLVRLADKYFATNAAASALDEAGERAIEAGDFKAALRWYTRLADSHPDRDQSVDPKSGSTVTHGLLWRAKAALCATSLSDAQPMRKLIDSLDEKTASERMPLLGGKRSVREYLADVRGELSHILEGIEGGLITHPTALEGSEGGRSLYSTRTTGFGVLGGGADRHGFLQSSALAEARLWRFNAFGRGLWDDELTGYESQTARKDAWMRLLQSGRMLASVPVASYAGAEGRTGETPVPQGAPVPQCLVFIHDSQSVWAIDPSHPDRPKWRYDLQAPPPSRGGLAADDEPPPQFTSLAADGRLYVHLETEQPATASGQTLMSSIIVCLDATTGTMIWENKLEGFATPFEDTRLDGAPLCHRGGYFVVARRRKPFGFESCHLLRFDAATGKLMWGVHLGESATGSYGYHRATVTHPAADGDLVFVQTNLGTIAGVSMDTGSVAWLTQYDSKYSDTPEGFWPSRMGRPTRAWQYPVAITWKDALVCMPLDSDKLMLLNQFDGKVQFEIALEKLGSPETVIGLRGDLLYMVGAQLLCYDLSTHGPVWQRPLDSGLLFGRGALTSKGVFVPTDHALLRYPLDGGPATSYRWSIEEAGNLCAMNDEIVVAGATSVYGLAAKEDAFAAMDRRMNESPTDPAAALALAELAFNTHEDARGVAAVEETVKRMGGFARMPDDQARRRLFKQLTQFATIVLNGTKEPRPSARADTVTQAADEEAFAASTAIQLLDMAGQCASDNEAHVTYRLHLARAQMAGKMHAKAIATYQQILVDRGLRGVRIKVPPELRPPGLRVSDDMPEDDAPVEIGTAITAWISRLTGDLGKSIYEPVEQQAGDRLKVAQATRDSAALLEVADAYPNSHAASTALIAHARIMCDGGDLAKGARSYRRALQGSDATQRPTLIYEYAACLAKDAKYDLAAQWVRRGQRDFPTYRLPPSPTLRAGLRNTCIAAGQWPVAEAYKRLYPEKIAVLDPVFSALPTTSWDALLTHCGGQLEARHPATGAAIWSRPVPCANQPQLLGMDAARFILSTGHRIFALTRTSGQIAWSVGEEPGDDPGEDPESIASWASQAMTGTRLFAATDRGELVCVDVETGDVRWRENVPSQIGNHLCADERHVCFATWLGRQHTIHIRDAATGAEIVQARPEDDWPVQALAMTPDGSVIVVFANAIHVLDPATGKSRFRIGTADRFVASTLFVDEEGIIVSTDGRRISKYDPDTGRMQWTSAPVTTGTADGIWTQVSDGVVHAACGDFVAAFDTADGRTLWSSKVAGGLRPESPRLTSDSVVVITIQPPDPPATKKESLRGEQPKAYRVTRLSRKDGAKAPIGSGEAIVTEPLANFGGLYVRDRSLIVVDGNRLFGYATGK